MQKITLVMQESKQKRRVRKLQDILRIIVYPICIIALLGIITCKNREICSLNEEVSMLQNRTATLRNLYIIEARENTLLRESIEDNELTAAKYQTCCNDYKVMVTDIIDTYENYIYYEYDLE